MSGKKYRSGKRFRESSSEILLGKNAFLREQYPKPCNLAELPSFGGGGQYRFSTVIIQYQLLLNGTLAQSSVVFRFRYKMSVLQQWPTPRSAFVFYLFKSYPVCRKLSRIARYAFYKNSIRIIAQRVV